MNTPHVKATRALRVLHEYNTALLRRRVERAIRGNRAKRDLREHMKVVLTPEVNIK